MVWEKICDIIEAFLPYDLDLNVLFHPDNIVGKSENDCWNWSLDNDVSFYVSSLRKTIDSRCLDFVLLSSLGARLFTLKSNFSFDV